MASELPDIVCLHGICAGAWAFPEPFVRPFVDAGFTVHRISYRGHGASEGRDRLRHARLSDYVEDVRRIIQDLERPPVLLGHSLGSAIAQVLLKERSPLAGLVLVSPVPPQGMMGVGWRLLWTDPGAYHQLFTAMTQGVSAVPASAGARLLFSTSEVTPVIADFFRRCGNESPWIMMDTQGFPRLGPLRYDVRSDPPVWVVSGRQDRLIRPYDAAMVATFYQTEVLWIDPGTHMLMFDADASKTATGLAETIKASLLP